MKATKQQILNARLLIVDDQPSNVLLLGEILRDAGYTCIETTTNPAEVLALYQKNRYDLILLDLLMPGMDGFQVMEQLRQVTDDGYLPVLAITAQPNHKQRALEAGARDFITKPFTLDELRSRVHNLLEVRLLYEKLRQQNQGLEQTIKGYTVELKKKRKKQ